MKVFVGRFIRYGELKQAERAASEVLSLPMNHVMDEQTKTKGIEAVLRSHQERQKNERN
jgi:dTDP-4-amino-4,6-dideoxygalactose transaminase